MTTEPAATTEFSPTVTPDHHIVGNIEPAKVIKGAVLIDENIAPDTDIGPAGCVEWRD